MNDFPNCVTNVGNMIFTPGAFNIVPARVELSLEYRAPTFGEFYRLGKAIRERLENDPRWQRLTIDVKRMDEHLPTPMHAQVQDACTQACETLGLTHMPLVSYAGHDAQSLADLCPVGMIFVPSVGGASHSAREFTRWEDCVNGANVLLQAAIRLAA
jgi:acetylornithine deacetylase/succinyl-diaminopimelate desuccinylase-like protein